MKYERSDLGATMVVQFLRYLMAGGTAVLVWYAVLIILVELTEVNKTLASVIGFVCGVPVNYTLQRHFVFNILGPHSVYFPRYVSVTLATLGLNAVIFWFVVEVVGINYVMGQTLSLGVVVVVNYLVNRVYTFAELAKGRHNQTGLRGQVRHHRGAVPAPSDYAMRQHQLGSGRGDP